MTMLLVIVTPPAIYVAADSRQYPSGQDTVQKIFLVGTDALMAHSGIGVIPADTAEGGSWDAAEELRRISQAAPNGAFEEQLAFIEERVKLSFARGLAQYCGAFRITPRFVIMLAKRDADGRAFFARQEFRVLSATSRIKRWSHRVVAAPVQILIKGQLGKTGVWWEVPPDCKVLPGNINFSQASPLMSISAIIQSVAGQSDSCTRQIGGPIRVVISDDAGARWLSPDQTAHAAV